ncbi:MAG: ABC transporter ATP-binding protein [Alphaproteobacteria bacterium]|nr:MAG: ABC transporter ATP-binding protein [Alphaproteobacteria bacterium]
MSPRKHRASHLDTYDTWPMLSRILRHYLWNHKRDLSWAGLAMFIIAVALALQAHLIQPLFDNGLISGRIGVINTIIFTIVGLTIIRGVATYYQTYYMESVGQRVVATMQDEMYSQTLRQHLGFFATNPTGTLTSRFVSDLQRLKYAVTQIFSSGLRDSGTIIGLFGNMLLQDVKLTLLTMIIFPLTVLPIRKFGRLTRKYSRVNQESTARMAHHLSQTLQHIRQVQSYTQEKNESKRMMARVSDVLDSTLRAVRIRAMSSPSVELIGTIVIAAIMLYAGQRIADGTLTTGSFASFMASLVMLSRPLKGITNLNNNIQEGLAAAQRAFEIIDAPLTITDESGATALTVKKGAINFSQVTLTYTDGTTALSDINLAIPAGHTVAFVGPSGAGKTSLLNLLPRFYNISHGHISIDGQDISHVTLKSLRSQMGLVTQDVAVFDESIAANIAYGNPKASQASIESAARAAAAHEFISALPHGYDTVLGENGLKLSGGQKQRLAIARAILKNAPILMLDEATAALDTASEKDVQKALQKLSKDRTTLIVAHRLSTIAHANTIMVLDSGKIVEQGSHAALLKKKGLYYKLWSMQANAEDAA